MRSILILAFLAFSLFSAQASKLRKDIQGTWLCVKILDSNGEPSEGKFGSSNSFLKFKFEKNALKITLSPFDGFFFEMYPLFKEHYFDLDPKDILLMPESIYYVVSLSEDQLVLQTQGLDDETIFYHFDNEKKYLDDFVSNAPFVDLGLILIEHITFEGKVNENYRYVIPNTPDFFTPRPTYDYSPYYDFGGYFTKFFKFDDNHVLDIPTGELIVEFDVMDKNVSRIQIVQGINQEIDFRVIETIWKSRKKWNALRINGKEVKSRARLHFIFYKGKAQE
ncbi:MAG: hypothetical protein JXR03_00955 [Cyclobacteriaceae bacterium]